MPRRRSYVTEQLALIVGTEAVPVTVDQDGIFWAEVDGDSYSAATFKGLDKLVQAKHNPTVGRCSVMAMERAYNGKLEAIEIVGIHQGNNNYLVRTAEDGIAQRYGNNDDRILHALSPGEAQQLLALELAEKEAERNIKAFLMAHRFTGLRAHVLRELKRARTAPDGLA